MNRSALRRAVTSLALASVATLSSFSVLQTRAASVDLSIRDEAGRPLPCRVLLRPIGGECVVPNGAVKLEIGPDRWFMCPGRVEIDVPAGRCTIRIERGLEFVRFKDEIDVPESKLTRTILLKRWVHMRERGYLCGESHLHLDTLRLGPMLVCEGLDFGSSLSWWNGPDPDRAAPSGPEPIRRLTFAGRRIPASVFDAELEHGWGAAYLQNLPAPLPLESDPHRPNLDYVRQAVESGGMVHYQSGWAREVGVDALMGYVDVVNVCNNNFFLHRFQPRSRYSNLLGVEGFPVYPGTDEGMMRLNVDSYYRLLNWGLQLPAGAGTASGVKQVPAGYNRAYVHVQAGASLTDFNAAWRAGRNFVTNGPMLFLRTENGQSPGDQIDLPSGGGQVRVRLDVLSDQVLTSVEIVQNGEVATAFSIDDPHKVEGDAVLDVNRGCWLAARCTARDDLLSDSELSAYANGERQQPSRLRFAHTSPIYVSVGGEAAAVRTSIQDGLKMMDRFEAYARENASAAYLPEILEAVGACRAKLQLRLQAANPQRM